MNPVFKDRPWELDVPPRWRVEDCDHCLEFTQPEGVGAMHISSFHKNAGLVADAETLEQITRDCPEDTDFERVRCGDFQGHAAEYVDWNSDTFWKKWFVACGKNLLFISYTCARGEEELEAEQASALLTTLRSRG